MLCSQQKSPWTERFSGDEASASLLSKTNLTVCRQTVRATAQADRIFSFTSRHFRNCVGTPIATVGEISGVIFLLFISLTFFPLYTGAHPLPLHVAKLLGLWMASVYFGYEPFRLYTVQEMRHLRICFSPPSHAVFLLNLWLAEGSFNMKKHTQSLAAYEKHWTPQWQRLLAP